MISKYKYAVFSMCIFICILWNMMLFASVQNINVDNLSKLKNGVPAYPVPFMAVAKTPYVIPQIPQKNFGIQQDFGYAAGFSGEINAATGQIGFPGYSGYSCLDISFDSEKLCLRVGMPFPFGRPLRTTITSEKEKKNLFKDDVFEILINPCNSLGKSRGYVYRIIGNAAGIYRIDRKSIIGKTYQSWDANVRYAVLLWQGVFYGGIQIPFKFLGGAPRNGEVWGIQMKFRYVYPKITAILSPTNNFSDINRFAQVRFDWNRYVNYRCHWLLEDMKYGTFTIQDGNFSNGSQNSITVNVQAHLFKGNKEINSCEFTQVVPKLATYYGTGKGFYIASYPANPSERDTFARITAYDESTNTLIYDQFIPYWSPPQDERFNWEKKYFGNKFTFYIGPYPSLGDFDYLIDCENLMKFYPRAADAVVSVSCKGKKIIQNNISLPKNGNIEGTIAIGKFINGDTYDVTAAIISKDGNLISSKTRTFIRKIMPFETAPEAGLSDNIIPPLFTAPVIKGTKVSVVERTYVHGSKGLLEKLIADKENILASPAVFSAKINNKSIILIGSHVYLHHHGIATVDYKQTFSGGGILLDVTGNLDFDGFYRFHVKLSSDSGGSVNLKDLCLEIPIKNDCATLIDAPVAWLLKGKVIGDGIVGIERVGFLSKEQGLLWNSKLFPCDASGRKGNMPPYLWIGDDYRGIDFSCVSQQGMHDSSKLPAAELIRKENTVIMRIWFVNKPIILSTNRIFEFALQASPYKPMPSNWRLWGDPTTYGLKPSNYGWGIGYTYPTYGRWLNLAKNKTAIDEWKKNNDGGFAAASASSGSECGGTPEYQQFWREWGSSLGWNKMKLNPLPEWMKELMNSSGVPYNGYVAVESASNSCKSNVDYRAWWFNEDVKYCGISAIYQDNPPFGYAYQPLVGYGYIKADGVKEPTSSEWNWRNFARRALIICVKNKVTNPAPGVWPNLGGAGGPVPGRSLCYRGLTGELNDSDKMPLDALRVWLSHQWGINIDWLMQEPPPGAPMKYWRALCSRLFLLDVTSFSRIDSGDVAERWLNALGIFWLDDPSVVWHPYYFNNTLKSTIKKTTFVSDYTAKGRALFIISNQSPSSVVETVSFKNLSKYECGGLKYFYNAETGEQIETPDYDTIRLFIPGDDYRLVIGFPKPWRFAAKNVLDMPDIPIQSTLNPENTITAICKQLLVSPKIKPVKNGDILIETWLNKIFDEVEQNPSDFIYLDENKCADINLGDKNIKLALIYDKRHGDILAVYVNPTNHDVLFPGDVRSYILKNFNLNMNGNWNPYVLDPVYGYSQWEILDLPAHSGKIEVLLGDATAYYTFKGPFSIGTMFYNLRNAVMANIKKYIKQ